MSINLELLNKAMADGDHGAIASALGFSIDPSTAEVLGNLGWAERMNASLVAKIAYLRTKIPQWIPCSDRLPDTDRDVLVFLGNINCQAIANRIMETWMLGGGERLPQEEVTHWQELPERPIPEDGM